jgi:tetratricopeptide (TPR) repeat protein
MEALERARALDASLPGIDYELGRAQYRAAHYRRSEPTLVRASRQEGVPVDVFFMLGSVYSKTGRPEMATVAFGLFVNRAPDPATGWRTLGRRLESEGEIPRAADAYRKSLMMDPRHARTRATLERITEEAAKR